MAISNTTTATVVESAVLTEWINREMRFAVRSPDNLHADIERLTGESLASPPRTLRIAEASA